MGERGRKRETVYVFKAPVFSFTLSLFNILFMFPIQTGEDSRWKRLNTRYKK
jgi:hypothetical protein